MKTPPQKTPSSELPPRDPNEKTCTSCEGKGEAADGKKCATCEGKGWTLIKPAPRPPEGKTEGSNPKDTGPKK
jgi:hypothetical protein